jgi:hypothetical protein
MKKILHFNQGPMAGREVEVDLDEPTIQSLLDTGYCTDVPDPPAPVERKVVERAVVAEVEPEPVEEKKPAKKKRVRKKRETPEG